MSDSDRHPLSEFERQVIREWAVADARAVIRDANVFARGASEFLDAAYWASRR